MLTKCESCDKKVEAKRNIGVGTFILVLITLGWWLPVILFYKKRCPICKLPLKKIKQELPKTKSIKVKCPLCNEKIPSDSKCCSSCKEDLSTKEVQEDIQKQLRNLKAGKILIGVLLFVVIGSFFNGDENETRAKSNTYDKPNTEQKVSDKNIIVPTKQKEPEIKTNIKKEEIVTSDEIIQPIKTKPVVVNDDSDRTKIIAIIKENANTEWGTDYEMVKYEIDNQTKAYEWVIKQTLYSDIMQNAKREWGYDYEMVQYEYNNQVQAYESL